ncbi:hypothetical protein ACOMHN_061330 [Nucella lapillus]
MLRFGFVDGRFRVEFDKSVTIDKKLEKLETDSRARNVKFFNVFEGRSTNESDCVRQVIQLLNRFYPSKAWSTDDVDKATRVGPRKDSPYPRAIVVTMHRWRDKILVLRDQESRKEMADTLNIRVATDLTDSQYDILREERQAGRRAFFYNGRLHYHTEKVPYHPDRQRYRNLKEREDGNRNYEDQLKEGYQPEDKQQNG